MTSDKQIQANIRNSLFSIGPATQQGKMISSRNALHHGIFAKDLVITTGDNRENEMEYHELFSELITDLAPVGKMEMLLVEKIAVNYWRLRRTIRYESGAIQEKLDNFMEISVLSRNHNAVYTRQRPVLEYYSYSDDISDAEYQEQAEKVYRMRRSEFNPAEDKSALEHVLRLHMDKDYAEFSDEDYHAAKTYIANLSSPQQGKLRRKLHEKSEQMLNEMREVRDWNIKLDRLRKITALPAECDLNKAIKYETSIERSNFRNLAALKILQDQRAKRENINDDRRETPPALPYIHAL